jgi:hypothetical protein
MTFQSVDIVAPSAVSKSRKHLPWIALALCTLAAVAIFAVVAVAPSDNQTELPVSLQSKKSKTPATTLQDVNADLAGLQDDLNSAIRDLQKASNARSDKIKKKNAVTNAAIKKANAKEKASLDARNKVLQKQGKKTLTMKQFHQEQEKMKQKKVAAKEKKQLAARNKVLKKQGKKILTMKQFRQEQEKMKKSKVAAAKKCLKNRICAAKQAAARKKTYDACTKIKSCATKRAAAEKKKKAALKKAAALKKEAALEKAEMAKIAELRRFIQGKTREVNVARGTEQHLKKLLAAHKSKPEKLIVAVATATTEVAESMYSVAQKEQTVGSTTYYLKDAQRNLGTFEKFLQIASQKSDKNARDRVKYLKTVEIPTAIKNVDIARFKKAAADDDLARAVVRLSTAKSELALAKKRASIK